MNGILESIQSILVDKALPFFVLLFAVVFFHELGHFIVAKMVGIRVERFSINIGPRLFGIQIGETDYCVSLVPLGGYVKMAGQEDFGESESTGAADEFYSKTPFQRILVVLTHLMKEMVEIFGLIIQFSLTL